MGDTTRPHRPGRAWAALPEERQATLARPLRVHGLGLRSGEPTVAELRPAPAGAGRTLHAVGAEIPCGLASVVDTRLATTLGGAGTTISMVEHLCAALYALGIDNVAIHVEGPELPVLDGSALGWVAALQNAGVAPQAAPRDPLVVREPLRVEAGEAWAELSPAPGLELDVSVDFPHPLIGRQAWRGTITPASFAAELAWARTFGFLRDAELLRAAGVARGASLENTVVYDEAHVMNPGGLRAPDEAVRHKALDAVGDIALLGRPLQGRLRAHRAGHALHVAVLQSLLQRRDARAA